MKYYCGIDLHATNCFLCVIDDKDNILLKEKVKNDLGAILYALESFSPKPQFDRVSFPVPVGVHHFHSGKPEREQS